jgi:hypothetical protein
MGKGTPTGWPAGGRGAALACLAFWERTPPMMISIVLTSAGILPLVGVNRL